MTRSERSRPRTSGAARRAGWNLVDQVISSVTNAALSFVVARSVDVEQFGGFAVAFSVFALAVGLSRALATSPLGIRFESRPGNGGPRGRRLRGGHRGRPRGGQRGPVPGGGGPDRRPGRGVARGCRHRLPGSARAGRLEVRLLRGRPPGGGGTQRHGVGRGPDRGLRRAPGKVGSPAGPMVSPGAWPPAWRRCWAHGRPVPYRVPVVHAGGGGRIATSRAASSAGRARAGRPAGCVADHRGGRLARSHRCAARRTGPARASHDPRHGGHELRGTGVLATAVHVGRPRLDRGGLGAVRRCRAAHLPVGARLRSRPRRTRGGAARSDLAGCRCHPVADGAVPGRERAQCGSVGDAHRDGAHPAQVRRQLHRGPVAVAGGRRGRARRPP